MSSTEIAIRGRGGGAIAAVLSIFMGIGSAHAAECDLPGRGTQIEVRLEKYAELMDGVAQLMGRRDFLGKRQDPEVHEIIIGMLDCANEAQKKWRKEITEAKIPEGDRTLGYDALDLGSYETAMLYTIEVSQVDIPKLPVDTCNEYASDSDYPANFHLAMDAAINASYWLFFGDDARAVSEFYCARRFYKKARENAPLISGWEIYARRRLKITEPEMQ